MAVCEQSGEPRLSAEPEFGPDFGEPPEQELCDDGFLDEEDPSLPLTEDEIGEICKSRPHSIKLPYVTLDFKEAPSEALPTTNDLIRFQEKRKADVSKWSHARGYNVTDSRLEPVPGFNVSSPYLSKTLEALTCIYYDQNKGSFSALNAFYLRRELLRAGLTPQLCRHELTLELREDPENPGIQKTPTIRRVPVQ
ncbi:Hypothetical protein NCS54_01371500 [Fusarium falciforme]|uniref:Hypothetical protein n=1 Tax=Fusarium falciforme TaxID=195108 RepID=UPI002300821B|nr:Hypothetical protein NCS54_01371500 [Fusarium falciforme]WAO96054.1 Hypothetical protein NCS54_01371500 [Fusarium falciforme]